MNLRLSCIYAEVQKEWRRYLLVTLGYFRFIVPKKKVTLGYNI